MPKQETEKSGAAAWAVPLVTTIGSGALSYLGGKEQQQAASAAAEEARRARQQGLAQLSNINIYDAADWMFPGLLPQPTTPGVDRTGNTWMETRPGFMGDILQRMYQEGNWPGQVSPEERIARYYEMGQPPTSNQPQPRAEGGPTESGQPYLVGEQGPEVMVPEQDGTVLPNPGTGVPSEGTPGGMEAMIQAIVMAVLQALMGGGAQGVPAGMGGEMGGEMPPMPPEGQLPPGRALGGAVRQNRPYMVGEQGPEVVVPGQPQPTEPIGGGGGGAQPSPSPQPAPPAAPAPTGPGNFAYPGQGATWWTGQYFNQPGQLSPIPYERSQEQANRALGTGAQMLQGSLSGVGVDPSSPMGQAASTSLALGAGRQRQEAARDYSLAEETLARQDVAQAFQQYLSMLQTIFGLQGTRAGAAVGGAFPQTAPIDPYAGVARGVSQLGLGLERYFQNQGGGGQDGLMGLPGYETPTGGAM